MDETTYADYLAAVDAAEDATDVHDDATCVYAPCADCADILGGDPYPLAES